jgi:hypothetical protein
MCKKLLNPETPGLTNLRKITEKAELCRRRIQDGGDKMQ